MAINAGSLDVYGDRWRSLPELIDDRASIGVNSYYLLARVSGKLVRMYASIELGWHYHRGCFVQSRIGGQTSAKTNLAV